MICKPYFASFSFFFVCFTKTLCAIYYCVLVSQNWPNGFLKLTFISFCFYNGCNYTLKPKPFLLLKFTSLQYSSSSKCCSLLKVHKRWFRVIFLLVSPVSLIVLPCSWGGNAASSLLVSLGRKEKQEPAGDSRSAWGGWHWDRTVGDIPATSADTPGCSSLRMRWILLSQTSDLDNPKQKAAFLSNFS